MDGATLASAAVLNWSGLSDEVKNTLTIITTAVSIAFLALGAILALSGANIPLGIALLLAGAVMIATAIRTELEWPV